MYLTVVFPNEEQQSIKEKEIRALTIQLEDMERKLELKENEIQERAGALYQLKVNKFLLNAHKVNHISSSTQCSIETADNATQVQEGIYYFNLILCYVIYHTTR